MLISMKISRNSAFFRFRYSYNVFFLLINVKMPTLYEQEKIHAQVSGAKTFFITSGPDLPSNKLSLLYKALYKIPIYIYIIRK